MSVVQTDYGPVRSAPAKKSIWLVIDDVPSNDAKDIESLTDQLKAEVSRLVLQKVDQSRRPRPECIVSAGTAETDKLRIFEQAR